ncbi:hypothetical protein HDV01_006530 [Terramyces sp. JEL0728]|nr:hypothetical protein HDV01_006530 [Terramyces sp. JEL0728]
MVEKQEQTARIYTSDTVVGDEFARQPELRDSSISRTDFECPEVFYAQPLSSSGQSRSEESQTICVEYADFECQTIELQPDELSGQSIVANPESDELPTVNDTDLNQEAIQECFLQNMKLEQRLAEALETNEGLKRQLITQSNFVPVLYIN